MNTELLAEITASVVEEKLIDGQAIADKVSELNGLYLRDVVQTEADAIRRGNKVYSIAELKKRYADFLTDKFGDNITILAASYQYIDPVYDPYERLTDYKGSAMFRAGISFENAMSVEFKAVMEDAKGWNSAPVQNGVEWDDLVTLAWRNLRVKMGAAAAPPAGPAPPPPAGPAPPASPYVQVAADYAALGLPGTGGKAYTVLDQAQSDAVAGWAQSSLYPGNIGIDFKQLNYGSNPDIIVLESGQTVRVNESLFKTAYTSDKPILVRWNRPVQPDGKTDIYLHYEVRSSLVADSVAGGKDVFGLQNTFRGALFNDAKMLNVFTTCVEMTKIDAWIDSMTKLDGVVATRKVGLVKWFEANRPYLQFLETKVLAPNSLDPNYYGTPKSLSENIPTGVADPRAVELIMVQDNNTTDPSFIVPAAILQLIATGKTDGKYAKQNGTGLFIDFNDTKSNIKKRLLDVAVQGYDWLRLSRSAQAEPTLEAQIRVYANGVRGLAQQFGGLTLAPFDAKKAAQQVAGIAHDQNTKTALFLTRDIRMINLFELDKSDYKIIKSAVAAADIKRGWPRAGPGPSGPSGITPPRPPPPPPPPSRITPWDAMKDGKIDMTAPPYRLDLTRDPYDFTDFVFRHLPGLVQGDVKVKNPKTKRMNNVKYYKIGAAEAKEIKAALDAHPGIPGIDYSIDFTGHILARAQFPNKNANAPWTIVDPLSVGNIVTDASGDLEGYDFVTMEGKSKTVADFTLQYDDIVPLLYYVAEDTTRIAGLGFGSPFSRQPKNCIFGSGITVDTKYKRKAQKPVLGDEPPKTKKRRTAASAQEVCQDLLMQVPTRPDMTTFWQQAEMQGSSNKKIRKVGKYTIEGSGVRISSAPKVKPLASAGKKQAGGSVKEWFKDHFVPIFVKDATGLAKTKF